MDIIPTTKMYQHLARQARTLKQIDQHPLVDYIEKDSDGSYWVFLLPGWLHLSTESDCIHEWSAKDTIEMFNDDRLLITREEYRERIK